MQREEEKKIEKRGGKTVKTRLIQKKPITKKEDRQQNKEEIKDWRKESREKKKDSTR